MSIQAQPGNIVKSSSSEQLRTFGKGYLNDRWIQRWRQVKSYEGESHMPRLPLTFGTINMLDPVVAQVTGYTLDTRTRYENIAQGFSKGGVGLVACQEANSLSAQIMGKHGYSVVGLEAQGIVSTDKVSEPSGYSLGRFKRAWSGVQLCFDPERYEFADEIKPTFFSYAPEHQKNWWHVFQAVWQGFGEAAKAYFMPRAWYLAATKIFESLSGPLRTDGLLITHLRDRHTQQKLIACVSHLESFDRQLSQYQLQEVIDHLNRLRGQYPDANIVMAADFNWQVGPGADARQLQYESIRGRLGRELGAVTMPMEQIAPTLVRDKVAIDGIFLVPPKGQHVKARGVSLAPVLNKRQTQPFSDHHGVINQFWLKE